MSSSKVSVVDDGAKGFATAVIGNDSSDEYQQEAAEVDEQPRYLFGFKLPSYYNKGEERALVRKLDIFLL